MRHKIAVILGWLANVIDKHGAAWGEALRRLGEFIDNRHVDVARWLDWVADKLEGDEYV